MYNILRHNSFIFADAIRTAGAEAKNDVMGAYLKATPRNYGIEQVPHPQRQKRWG